MRPKILFVINSLAGGGAERVFTTLIAGSAAYAERWDVAVALLDRDEEAYALPDWVRVHRLDARHGLVASIRALGRVVTEERPAIALSFLTRANVATAFAMGRRGLPFVLSERVNTTAHLNEGRAAAVSKTLVRLAYPRAARILAVSQGVADTLVADFAVRPGRIAVVPNPVDVARIAALAARSPDPAIAPPYALAMGRLVPNKNFALALHAFAESGATGRLVILGQGPERDSLRALGDRLGLGDRLVMPGFAANPYPLLAAASMFILSSNAEGFPNALVEAMALGVPAVATDCASGPAEVLDVAGPPSGAYTQGRGGLLVPVDDAPAMATALRALADPGTWETLGKAGKARVADFGVEAAVKRYWDVIEDVHARHAT